MFHKILSTILHWYWKPEVQSVLSDIKLSVLISGFWSSIMKIAVPELAHGAFVLFFAGVSTVLLYFLNRYLKKNHP